MWQTLRNVLTRGEFGFSFCRDQVLSERWFSLHLMRERARADRTGEGFLLVVLGLDSHGDGMRDALETAVLERTRISDAKGWLNSHLGLLLPATASDEVPGLVRSLEELVRSKLGRGRIKGEVAPLLTYDIYSYPGSEDVFGVVGRIRNAGNRGHGR